MRQAVSADIDRIQEIRRSVRENRLVSAVITDSDVRDAIEITGRGWVAEVNGRVVGFAIGNAKTGNIWALFVHPDHERRGYGRQLHDAMVEWLWSQGLDRLWLTTQSGTRAQGFYEAAGWERVGVTDRGELRFEKRAALSPAHGVVVRPVDPRSEVALSLLREAAIDVRPLYAAEAGPPWPENSALGPRDVYVVAFLDGVAVGCGSVRRLDDVTAEVQRMYVHRDHRRRRIGQAVLSHLEKEAKRLDYACLRLETGNRQDAAMAFYEASGYRRIGAFGKYVNDPSSVCYERIID